MQVGCFGGGINTSFGRMPPERAILLKPAVELASQRGYFKLTWMIHCGNRSGARPDMTTFKDREDSFEKKFAHDEELRFKATARRNKLLGLWAAEKMGLTGEAADAYAMEVIRADFKEAGDEDVFEKVRGDFDAKGVDQSDHQIRRTMTELMQAAMDQLRKEG